MLDDAVTAYSSAGAILHCGCCACLLGKKATIVVSGFTGYSCRPDPGGGNTYQNSVIDHGINGSFVFPTLSSVLTIGKYARNYWWEPDCSNADFSSPTDVLASIFISPYGNTLAVQIAQPGSQIGWYTFNCKTLELISAAKYDEVAFLNVGDVSISFADT